MDSVKGVGHDDSCYNAEGKVPIPLDVDTQYRDLCQRHKSLATQMAAEKVFPPIKMIEVSSYMPRLAHSSYPIPILYIFLVA